MISMTGFGYSEYQDESIHITVDLKSYNNRYLDILVNLPAYLSPLEPKLRGFISAEVSRGRVEVLVKVRELQEDIAVFLDEKAALNYTGTLKRLAAIAETPDEVMMKHLVEMEGVLKLEKNRDIEQFWKNIEPRLVEALEIFQKSRRTEGEHTRNDIKKWWDILQKGYEQICTCSEDIESKLKENIQGRFREMLGEQIDESRILAETAVMLVKYGINEELSRLGAHLAAFRADIEQDGPCGKRLDFLCQELNREINTIGSKSTMLEVNQIVVQMKDGVENMREQLRNIE